MSCVSIIEASVTKFVINYVLHNFQKLQIDVCVVFLAA
jgi:hypothetical protein